MGVVEYCKPSEHNWKSRRKGGKVEFCTKCPRWRVIGEPIVAKE